MNYRNVACSLIVVGGILGLLPACISLLSVPLMADLLGSDYAVVWEYARLMGQYGMIGYPNIGPDLQTIMLVWSFLSLAGGFLAAYSGFRAFRGLTGDSKIAASSAGVLLFLAFSWVPAFIVTAGCLILIFYKA